MLRGRSLALVMALAVGSGAQPPPPTVQCVVPLLPPNTVYEEAQCVAGNKVPGGVGCELACSKGHAQSESGSYQAYCDAKEGKWDPPFNPQCTACALNFYQDQEAPTPVDCKACPESAVTAAKGSDDVSKCLCSPGFFGIIVNADSQCKQCPEAQYKPERGADSCTNCPEHSTTADPGTTAVNQCLCRPGFTGSIKQPGDNCQPCPAGTWSSELGSAASCIKCTEHATTTTGTGLPASQLGDCLCEKGYEGDVVSRASTCNSCVAGTYKDVVGPGTCVPCPEHSRSSSPASDSADKCVCEEGWEGVIRTASDECCPADEPERTPAGRCKAGEDGGDLTVNLSEGSIISIIVASVALLGCMVMLGMYIGRPQQGCMPPKPATSLQRQGGPGISGPDLYQPPSAADIEARLAAADLRNAEAAARQAPLSGSVEEPLLSSAQPAASS